LPLQEYKRKAPCYHFLDFSSLQFLEKGHVLFSSQRGTSDGGEIFNEAGSMYEGRKWLQRSHNIRQVDLEKEGPPSRTAKAEMHGATSTILAECQKPDKDLLLTQASGNHLTKTYPCSGIKV
jgi:hypothetical protein